MNIGLIMAKGLMDLATAKGNGPTEFGPNENIGAVGTQGCK